MLPKAIRGENGYREYPNTAVKMLSFINDSQRLGFSLSEIRDGPSEAASYFPSRATMVKALRNKPQNTDQHMKKYELGGVRL